MCARWSRGWRLFAGVLSEHLRGEGPALRGCGRPRDPRRDPQQGERCSRAGAAQAAADTGVRSGALRPCPGERRSWFVGGEPGTGQPVCRTGAGGFAQPPGAWVHEAWVHGTHAGRGWGGGNEGPEPAAGSSGTRFSHCPEVPRPEWALWPQSGASKAACLPQAAGEGRPHAFFRSRRPPASLGSWPHDEEGCPQSHISSSDPPCGYTEPRIIPPGSLPKVRCSWGPGLRAWTQ